MGSSSTTPGSVSGVTAQSGFLGFIAHVQGAEGLAHMREEDWLHQWSAWPGSRKLLAWVSPPGWQNAFSITALDCRAQEHTESNPALWPVLAPSLSRGLTGINQFPRGNSHPPIVVLFCKSTMQHLVVQGQQSRVEQYPQDVVPMSVNNLFEVVGSSRNNNWTTRRDNPYFWLQLGEDQMIVSDYLERDPPLESPPSRQRPAHPPISNNEQQRPHLTHFQPRQETGEPTSMSTAASRPRDPCSSQDQAHLFGSDAGINPEADNAGRRVAQRTTMDAGPSGGSRTAGAAGGGAGPVPPVRLHAPPNPPAALQGANMQSAPQQDGRAMQPQEGALESVRQATPAFRARVAALRRPIDQAEAQFNVALAALEAAEQEKATAQEQLSQCRQSERQFSTQLRAQVEAHAAALHDILRNHVFSLESWDNQQAIRAREDELAPLLFAARASAQAAQGRLQGAEANVSRLGMEAQSLMRTLLP